MTRDKLISQLAYMRDYTIIPDDFYATVKARKKKPDKHYNAGFDKRFSGLLRYAVPEDPDHADYLTYVSFAIAASLSLNFMKKPSRFQLSRMLQITGYTPKDMEDYLNRENGLCLDSVPSHQLQESVFLLTHAIEDVLSAPGEWTGKKRKRENPALPRLQQLAQYMKENNLLTYMAEWLEDEERRSKVDTYEAFVLRHADLSVRKWCIAMETEDALRQAEDRMGKIQALRQDAILNAVRSAPASSPKIMPGISQSAVEDTKDVYLKAASIMSGEITVPSWELQALMDRSMAIYPDNIRKIVDDAAKELAEISRAYSRLTEKADDESDAIEEKEHNWMRCEYLPSVAAGALRAILTGEDEIFKLKIGRNIWGDFMTESNLPIPVVPYEDLPDEFEWNSINPDSNGRLGLKIYDEDDIMSVAVERRDGTSDMTLPLASMLAKFSGMPVEKQLYMGKYGRWKRRRHKVEKLIFAIK